MKKKYVVLGAGPAGLTIASHLKARGEEVLVIEKEKEAG
ncbi:MAG: FAD-dependent oxidoreductase, partial [Lachnospiraceae bacterium]|nr:FAD-dependent oxidoreductase [Lachnospiraceae bacterium]